MFRNPLLFGAFLAFVYLAPPAHAQLVDEIKLGTGASFLGTGDVIIAKLEGEATHQWNRISESGQGILTQ